MSLRHRRDVQVDSQRYLISTGGHKDTIKVLSALLWSLAVQENLNKDFSWFQVLDTDKDGKISSDEYLSAWCEYFLGEDPASPYRTFFGPVVNRQSRESFAE